MRFVLERGPNSSDLLDCSNKTLKIEPLVTVEGLEKFLNGVVSGDSSVCLHVQCSLTLLPSPLLSPPPPPLPLLSHPSLSPPQVAKQWYDHDRSSYHFVQLAQQMKSPLVFRRQSDFDQCGIFYWVGSNGGTAEWVNPAARGLVVVSCSEGRVLPYGSLEDILSRDSSPRNCHTKDDRNSWFAVDLGLWITPTAYTLRHSRGYGR